MILGNFRDTYLFDIAVTAWAYYLTYCFLLQQQMLFKEKDKLCDKFMQLRDQIALYLKKNYDILISYQSY